MVPDELNLNCEKRQHNRQTPTGEHSSPNKQNAREGSSIPIIKTHMLKQTYTYNHSNSSSAAAHVNNLFKPTDGMIGEEGSPSTATTPMCSICFFWPRCQIYRSPLFSRALVLESKTSVAKRSPSRSLAELQTTDLSSSSKNFLPLTCQSEESPNHPHCGGQLESPPPFQPSGNVPQ